MKNILIICAMEDELNALIPKIDVKLEKLSWYENKVYTYIEDDKYFYFTYSGISKVLASMNLTKILSNLKIDYIFNFGTCGAIDKNINILDIVLANKVQFHDVDVCGFGYEIGQIPGERASYLTNNLTDITEYIINKNIEYKIGTLLTGDKFIESKDKSLELLKKFKDGSVVDMEGSAYVCVANNFKVPIMIFKGVSDNAHYKSTIEFDKYLEEVMKKFKTILIYILERNYE